MHVMRIVPNVVSDEFSTSSDFYGSMFDMTVSVELDGWYLQLMAESDPRLNVGFLTPNHRLVGDGAAPATPSSVVVTVHVDDVDEAYARAQSLDAEIVVAIRNEDYGQRRFVVVDPNGVLLNVMSPAP